VLAALHSAPQPPGPRLLLRAPVGVSWAQRAPGALRQRTAAAANPTAWHSLCGDGPACRNVCMELAGCSAPRGRAPQAWRARWRRGTKMPTRRRRRQHSRATLRRATAAFGRAGRPPAGRRPRARRTPSSSSCLSTYTQPATRRGPISVSCLQPATRRGPISVSCTRPTTRRGPTSFKEALLRASCGPVPRA